MNRRMVLHMVGQIVRLEGILLLLPLMVSLLYRESSAFSFALTAVLALVLGSAMLMISRPRTQEIYAKDGFVIVAFAWIFLSLIGAIPFTLSGGIPSYIDALFETVSGFTTTGASILPDPSVLDHGLLFWRSFTHWIGGMGVLVLMMIFVSAVSGRSIHILRAEVPGPTVGKLVPRVRKTARILYLIYIGLTLLQIVLLLCGGMSLFDSVVHAFGTAGTGGFGVYASSIGGYSPYLQWVIGIFMLLFGLNFNLYYLLLIRRFRSVLRSEELWCYLGLAAVATVAIVIKVYPLYQNLADTVRLSFFQVSSIMTTTGYSTADFNTWPELSRGILLVLMFVGACAGSTAGGLKMSRVILLGKMIRRDIKHMLHPRSVGVVRFEGKTVEDATLRGVSTYFALYMLVTFAVFLILSLEPFSLETNLSATVACFNNIGPGLDAVGPAANYAAYSVGSKLVLSGAMLLGRLEIFPLLILFTPSTWLKK